MWYLLILCASKLMVIFAASQYLVLPKPTLSKPLCQFSHICMLLNQFDIAAMPTYPNNNIQQTKNNPFNENMKDRTGVILIHILLYLQSSQHQKNTYHQTGFCSEILQLSILFTQIKKKIYTNYCLNTSYYTSHSTVLSRQYCSTEVCSFLTSQRRVQRRNSLLCVGVNTLVDNSSWN